VRNLASTAAPLHETPQLRAMRDRSLLRAMLAELIGTFALVFAGAGAIMV